MRVWILAIGFVALLSPSGWAEVWNFSCTEAVSLLKAAQDRVVQKHDQLQEAKFSLRHAPKEFDGCRRSRRGFDGGEDLLRDTSTTTEKYSERYSCGPTQP